MVLTEDNPVIKMWQIVKIPSSLSWAVIMAICLLTFPKVIECQVTLSCQDSNNNPCPTPCIVFVPENTTSDTCLLSCTIGNGNGLTIKSQTPAGSFTTLPIDQPNDVFGLYFVNEQDYELNPSLVVTIVGTDGTDTSPSIIVYVNLQDLDDNTPYIATDKSTIQVDENTLSDNIVQLTVTDGDGSSIYDATSVTLSFTGPQGDFNGIFKLTDVSKDHSGYIANVGLNQELDYETTVSYSLSITATDGGGADRTITIVVNVNDVEDSPPYFTHIAPYTSISESQSPGLVLQVTAVDGDRGINNPVTYDVIDGNINSDFSINADTGELTLVNPLDRDNGTSLYVITITATEVGDVGNSDYQANTSCTISVEDVDDNSPTFSYQTYSGSILENSVVGTIIQFDQQIIVTDIDYAENAAFEVTLDDPDGIFEINPTSGQSSQTFSISVKDSSLLDYETTESVTATVTAKGTIDPTKVITATLTIDVLDVNDDSPIFDQSSYTGTILETVLPGTLVLAVGATDKDATASFNTVTYRLVNDGSVNFVIDENTGDITVAPSANLDPNSFTPVKYVYYLTVYADDNGAHYIPCSVNITITDVNNKAPQFDANGLFNTAFFENVEYSTNSFYTVSATDIDEDSSLVYSIDFTRSTSYDDRGRPLPLVLLDTYFTIDEVTGELFLLMPADREVFDSVNLYLVVYDTNTDPEYNNTLSTDTGTLFIQVNDTNDCTPLFTSNYYTGSVKENADGTIVTLSSVILANDDDRDYAAITYSINPANSYFIIDPISGLLSTNDAIDYETDQYILLTIQAADNGVPPNNATSTVNVTIINVNDNEPIFIQPPYHFNVSENDVSIIGKVSATDADLGDYGVVCYSIEPSTGEEFCSYFEVDPGTGDVTLSKGIDYEAIVTPTCTLTVDANDNCPDQINTLKATATLIVDVQPVNEGPPTITPIGLCEILEDADINSMVCQVIATDSDKTLGGPPLTYSMEIETDLFAINEDTGEIDCVKSLIMNTGDYDATIIVCDSASSCSNASTTITVIDVNNQEPIIISPDSDVNITIRAFNCTNVGDKVATVNYTDADTNPDYTASKFSLISLCDDDSQSTDDTGHFSIDQNGVIKIAATLNLTDCAQYTLQVTVANIEDDSLYDIADYTVPISWCSGTDSPPVFYSDARLTNCSIYETAINAPPSDPCQWKAPHDIDMENHGQDVAPIYCYITYGDDLEIFVTTSYLDNNVSYCAVSVKQGATLDFEAQQLYQLTISASEDQNTPTEQIPYSVGNNSLALVTIQVLDVNDMTPGFNSSPFYAGLTSDYNIGDPVATMAAYDVDTVDANDLTYSMGPITILSKANMATVPTTCLSLDPNTGVITLEYKFSDDMSGYIEFNATVYDGGKLHSNSTDAKIYVVSSSEKLVCYAMKEVKDFQALIPDFQQDFSNYTGYVVIVDVVLPMTGADGNPEPGKCDVIIHMTDSQYNILSADDAMRVVNDHSSDLYTIVFPKYGVYNIRAYVQQTDNSNDNITEYILIAVAAVLAVICIALIMLSVYTSRKMKRKLKAATAPAFGSQNSGLNRIEVPNSNLHALEGSNPIYSKSNLDVDMGTKYGDETSDNISIASSMHDLRNDDKFEGGINNPTFEERMENYFDDAGSRKSENSGEINFGDDDEPLEDFKKEFSDPDRISM